MYVLLVEQCWDLAIIIISDEHHTLGKHFVCTIDCVHIGLSEGTLGILARSRYEGELVLRRPPHECWTLRSLQN